MPSFLFYPYYGPNRRSDKKVVEVHLDFAGDDALGNSLQPADIKKKLVAAGALAASEPFPGQAPGSEHMASYSSLLAQAALLFQRNNGHRVEYFSVVPDLGRKK